MRLQINEGRLYIHYGSAQDLPMLTTSYCIVGDAVYIEDEAEAEAVEAQANADGLTIKVIYEQM